MPTEIPLDVMEAMLAAANKGIRGGWTTHQVLCAALQAANDMGWVLKRERGGRNAGVDIAVANASGKTARYILIDAEEMTEHMVRKLKPR